jgi:RNA polymerase sigma factor (sigma-70 family)
VDAEDAFQATFLALLRRPSSVRKPASLACWLHGTAYRIAHRVREQAERRRISELDAPLARGVDPHHEAACRELGRIVEEEVHALPERLRAVLLPCYWEGLTNEETARRLGWPCGTVKTRLAQARQRLHDRLIRRGVALPVGVATVLLAPGAGEATLPPMLASSAIRALGGGTMSPRVAALAAGLRQGVAAKMKLAMLVLTLGVVAAGFGAQTAGKKEAPNASRQSAKVVPPAHVDLQGDPLPDHAVARLGTVRFRASGLVLACAYSPDGKTLAAGSADHTVTLFDATTGTPIRRLQGYQQDITSLAYAPDSRTLAAGGSHSNISIYDTASGKLLRQFAIPAGPVWSLTYTPDGKGLISAGHDSPMILWDPATGKESRRFISPQKESIRCVVLSPDGRTIASAGETIRLWETATGKMIRRLEGQKNPIRALAFSPDGKLLASGRGEDDSVWLWETATGEVRHRFPDDSTERKKIRDSVVRSLAFSPDGKTLVAGGGNYSLRFWDVATGRNLREILGRKSITYSGYHDGGIQCVAFSRDGKRLVLGRDNQLTLLDVPSGEEVLSSQAHRGGVRRLFFSPDGKRLVTTSDDPSRRVLEWDAITGQLIRPIPGKVLWAHVVSISSDRRILAATEHGTALHLWDTMTGAEIRQIPLPLKRNSDSPGEILFSPDGKLLAVSEASGEAVWLFDAFTSKQVCVVEGMGSPAHVFSLRFSEDSRLLTAVANSTIHVAEVPSGRELLRITLPKGRTTAVAVSPDGRTVATPLSELFKDGRMTLWEAATGRERLVFPCSPSQINCVRFSPDGLLLAAGGWDRAVYVWDTVTGKQLARLEGHQGYVEWLEFSPDSRRIAAVSPPPAWTRPRWFGMSADCGSQNAVPIPWRKKNWSPCGLPWRKRTPSKPIGPL